MPIFDRYIVFVFLKLFDALCYRILGIDLVITPTLDKDQGPIFYIFL